MPRCWRWYPAERPAWPPPITRVSIRSVSPALAAIVVLHRVSEATGGSLGRQVEPRRTPDAAHRRKYPNARGRSWVRGGDSDQRCS